MEDDGNKEDDWIRNREIMQYVKEFRKQINEKGMVLSKEAKEIEKHRASIK